MKNVATMLLGIALISMNLIVAAQDNPPDASVTPPVLSELEQLTLRNLLQGFTIAQFQRQAAQRNEDAARGAFWAAVNRLRAEKNAPEAEFTFNPQTMSFTAKPPAAAAAKPQSPAEKGDKR